MGLRYRPMQPTDVGNCVQVLTKIPAISQRYGSAIVDVRAAWQRLIGCEAMGTAVFEEVDGAQITTWGVGVGIFVHDDFVRELKTPPLFWVGPELAKRVVRGDSPILSDNDVREANSKEGLNLLVWEACPIPEFAKRPDAYHLMMTAFIDLYRGFLCNEAITSQAESAERLQWNIDGGGLLWDAAQGRYVRSLGKDLAEVFREPHIVGTTPEVESGRPGSGVGPLFDYRRPELGFSRGEQRLLLAALPGRTDEELCRELGHVSPNRQEHVAHDLQSRRVALARTISRAPTNGCAKCGTRKGKKAPPFGLSPRTSGRAAPRFAKRPTGFSIENSALTRTAHQPLVERRQRYTRMPGSVGRRLSSSSCTMRRSCPSSFDRT